MPIAMTTRVIGRQTNVAAPRFVELSALAMLVAFYFAADTLFETTNRVVNVVGPLAFIAILAFGSWQMLKADAEMIWTPLLTFRLSSLVFFGFGALVPLFVNSASLEYMRNFYDFSEGDMAKLNLISACCVLLVLASSAITMFFLREPISKTSRKELFPSAVRFQRMKTYGVVFLIFGFAIKYLVVVPITMGWVSGDLSGAIVALYFMSLCGIYLLTVWSLSSRPIMFLLICGIVAIETLVGLLELSKTEALQPLLVFLMALVVQKPTYKRILSAFGIVVFVFGIMQPLVSFSRDEYSLRGSEQSTFEDRLKGLARYFGTPTIEDNSAELQASYMRMSYVNAGTFAIASYDYGYPGNSFDGIFIVLIPRLLWPDKPLFNVGQEFARLAVGIESVNSVSPGLFAEAYWNFGWLGLPAVMVPFGIILALLTNYNLNMLRREDWLFLPIMFINMRLGLNVDGQFVNTVIGTVTIAIGLHCVASIARAFLQRNKLAPVGRF